MNVLLDQPLSRHLASRSGGPCRAWAVVHELSELQLALASLTEQHGRVMILGAGTRTLCREGGLEAAVIRLGTGFAGLSSAEDLWRVGAAVPVPALVAAAAAAGWSGVEDLAATPGSFGAALSLDEGPNDGWAGIVAEARFVTKGRKEIACSYEELVAAKARAIITGATLRLRREDPAKVLKRTRERMRGEGAGRAPAGSWYVAPKRGSLRDILVAAELPDVRLRQAWVPPMAPELIVNLGGATAADLALLHKSAVERVATRTGVELGNAKTWIGRP